MTGSAGRADAFPVVALVCSLGGLTALSAVLSQLPADFRAAVVVLQHSSPTHLSRLPDILRRRSWLPVDRAADGDLLRPGHVLVIPEAKHAIVDADGRLRLVDSDGAPRPSADLLLATLAVSLGPRVIAVVLTGSGTDGATGSEVVYACGGVTLVEDPATARAASMPTAALRRDDPEAVLPLADIAGKLVELTARDSAPSPPVWWEPEPLRQPSGAGSRSPDPGRGVRVR